MWFQKWFFFNHKLGPLKYTFTEVRVLDNESELKLVERKCEELVKSVKWDQSSSFKKMEGRKPLVCYGCHDEGHIRKNCNKEQNKTTQEQNPGNGSQGLSQ